MLSVKTKFHGHKLLKLSNSLADIFPDKLTELNTKSFTYAQYDNHIVTYYDSICNQSSKHCIIILYSDFWSRKLASIKYTQDWVGLMYKGCSQRKYFLQITGKLLLSDSVLCSEWFTGVTCVYLSTWLSCSWQDSGLHEATLLRQCNQISFLQLTPAVKKDT